MSPKVSHFAKNSKSAMKPHRKPSHKLHLQGVKLWYQKVIVTNISLRHHLSS